jgi:hypothetical protein
MKKYNRKFKYFFFEQLEEIVDFDDSLFSFDPFGNESKFGRLSTDSYFWWFDIGESWVESW